MTPLRVCGFIALAALTLLFLILIIIAMWRVIRSPVQLPHTNVQDIPIDILVIEPEIELKASCIAKQQSVLLVPGMSILVYQQTEQDGLYLMDQSNEMIRFDCIKKDNVYPVDIGIHRGLRFQVSHSTEKERVVRHVVSTPTESISLEADVVHLLLFLHLDAKQIEIRNLPKLHCLITVVNECSECVVILASTANDPCSYSVSKGIHFYSLVDNALIAMG